MVGNAMSRISSGVGGEIRHDIYSCYTRIAHRAHIATSPAAAVRHVSPEARHGSCGPKEHPQSTEIPKLKNTH